MFAQNVIADDGSRVRHIFPWKENDAAQIDVVYMLAPRYVFANLISKKSAH